MIKRAAGVQFNPWDHVYHYDCSDAKVKPGDHLIVRVDTGLEIAKVVSVAEVDDETLDEPLRQIVRRATAEDVKRGNAQQEKRDELLSKARTLVEQRGLAMKLVDCYFSFDGGRVTFVFTADGRVDFRELVKDLARAFQKSIRLQQVGIRDEARRMGGFGPCGREVCCKQFLGDLTSVTTEMARIQQVHSRGSDRISGACGRLMCCLAYEAADYEAALKDFPPIDSTVTTKLGKGTVSSYNVIKKTVMVRIDKGVTEVPLEEVRIV
ncbi:MAG: regulatory iron-sulfur-containing complex subunit RicT [Patescibacteria group bacterium]